MPSKKQLKVFKHYYEAIVYCVNNDLKYKEVVKHPSRPNTMYNWYVILKNKKPLTQKHEREEREYNQTNQPIPS